MREVIISYDTIIDKRACNFLLEHRLHFGGVLVKSSTPNFHRAAVPMPSSGPAFPPALPFLASLAYQALHDRLEAIIRKTSIQDVLLVEDNPADIYLIQRAIADCNPEIRTWLVSRGIDVLPFLRHEPPFGNVPSPGLILLDLNLPESDGHAILDELRGVAPYQTTPVVILRGNERAREETRCLELGASAYVQKSMDFTTYFGSIQALIRGWLGADSSPPEGSASGC